MAASVGQDQRRRRREEQARLAEDIRRECEAVLAESRARITAEKRRLAPWIKGLRAARGEFQRLDAVYQERRGDR